jgi:hypothetical protein
MRHEREILPEQREEQLNEPLFSPETGVIVERLQLSSTQIMDCLTSIQKGAACPLCGRRSSRMYSQYVLTFRGSASRLSEGACSSPVCDTPSSARRIFCERLACG